MSDNSARRSTTPASTKLLHKKPQHRSHRIPAILLRLLGGILIVGVVAIVAWQALAQHPSSTSSHVPGTSIPTKGNDNGNATPPGWNDPEIYWQTIRTHVAQGLHLSVAQITTQLQTVTTASTATTTHSSSKKSAATDPGAPMANLAVQQGMTTDQLRALELNALQTACRTMVTRGNLTQADADHRMEILRGWDQGTLNWYVMHAFTGQ